MRKPVNTYNYFPEIDLSDLKSDEEFYYLFWLCELCEYGYIETAEYESETFTLTNGYTKFYEKQLKTKVKREEETIAKPIVYTPDFKIYWTEKAVGVFYMDYTSDCKLMHGHHPLYSLGCDLVSYTEVKGSFDPNNTTRATKQKIAWLFDKHKVYTNIHFVPDIFKKTFTPKEFMVTKKQRKLKDLKYDVKTIEDF
jgi:hypothetical protein